MLSNHDTDYSKYTDEQLETSLSQVEIEIKQITNQKKRIVETILVRKNDELESLLKAKDEPYGAVHIGNFDVTFPKKVTWDQKELASLAQQIMSAGEDPAEYIKIEYDVSEKKFSAWPTPIKNQFIPARTIARGNPTIKISTKEKE
jgi:hypothetical protein